METAELKPGVEMDRLVAEAIRSECIIAGNTVFLDTGRFQPSDDLNAAFWAAEQIDLFGIRGFSCELAKIGNLWNLRKGCGSWVLGDSAKTLAMAICKAILEVKEQP